jgi:hypothetical protein
MQEEEVYTIMSYVGLPKPSLQALFAYRLEVSFLRVTNDQRSAYRGDVIS